MELEEIEKIKEQAEEYISKIVNEVEKKTKCVCVDLQIGVNQKSKCIVNLSLQIKDKEIESFGDDEIVFK